MTTIHDDVFRLIDHRATSPEEASRAKYYVTDVADCTCDDDYFGDCWYRLSDSDKATEALDYARFDGGEK